MTATEPTDRNNLNAAQGLLYAFDLVSWFWLVVAALVAMLLNK
jgi:hypothetical protein